MENIFVKYLSNMWYLGITNMKGGDCENGKFAQSPIRSKDFKTTFFTVAPFMIQISPKYLHSRNPQNYITFNSSQIFETHPNLANAVI